MITQNHNISWLLLDGFYDSGLINTHAKFESIEHYREAAINDKQAILLVNLPESFEVTKNVKPKNVSILKSNFALAGLKTDQKTEKKQKSKRREESLMIPQAKGQKILTKTL